MIEMAKVEIYTKAYCPYCTHALALLKNKSADYNEIKIDGDMTMRNTMIERSNGAYTVPQIFINDVLVGGCDQLVALERNNQLDALLNAK
jgi:glutaredoxin 3